MLTWLKYRNVPVRKPPEEQVKRAALRETKSDSLERKEKGEGCVCVFKGERLGGYEANRLWEEKSSFFFFLGNERILLCGLIMGGGTGWFVFSLVNTQSNCLGLSRD